MPWSRSSSDSSPATLFTSARPPWIDFLAGAGSVILTSLAGAEIVILSAVAPTVIAEKFFQPETK